MKGESAENGKRLLKYTKIEVVKMLVQAGFWDRRWAYQKKYGEDLRTLERKISFNVV